MYSTPRYTHNWLAKLAINHQILSRCQDLTGSVLDIGCGERPFEVDILRYADFYIGVDWSSTLHELRADVVANANRGLPFRDASVEHVVSFEVLEHLCEPDMMLREAFRTLKPGGGLTVSVPFQWWVHEASWDYQRFTRYGLDYRLRKAGFIDISITPRSGFWSMWLLKLNYQLKRLPRGPRPIRMAMTACLIPIWWINQTIAPQLDKLWPEERETTGYFATARKPWI